MHAPSRKKHRISGKGLDLWAVDLNDQFLVAVQNGMNFNCACAESETPRYQKKRYCTTVRITYTRASMAKHPRKEPGKIRDLKTWRPNNLRKFCHPCHPMPSYIYESTASSRLRLFHFATVGVPTSCAMVVHCDDLTWSFDVKTWEAWTTLWIGAENGKELRLKCQELNGMLMYLAHSIWRLKTMSLADIMNH